MEFAIRRAGHIVLRVTDVERTKRLLENVLGFRLSGSNGPFYFLSANPVSNHHMIGVRPHPGPQSIRKPDAEQQIGMVSVAYEVADFDELRRLYGRVARDGDAYGAHVVDVRRRRNMRTFVFADADGNRLEFYALEPAGGEGSRGDDLALGAGPDLGAELRVCGTSHVTLRASDLERSRRFYEEVLGMVSLGADAEGRHYLAGSAAARRPHLALEGGAEADAPRPAPREMFGMDHFAFELGSFAELQRAYRRFKATGTPIHHTVDHGVTLSIYFNDPDGNLMEVYHDVPRAEYLDPVTPFAGAMPLEERLTAAVAV